MDLLWWILIGVAVFALSGIEAVDKYWKAESFFETVFFGTTLVPSLYISIQKIGLSWWQILFWIIYLSIAGIVLERE